MAILGNAPCFSIITLPVILCEINENVCQQHSNMLALESVAAEF